MTKSRLLRILAQVPHYAEIVFSSHDDGVVDDVIERAYVALGRKGQVIVLSPACGREVSDEDIEAEEVFV